MASMPLAWLADALILLGAITSGVAIYGLIRLPDIYTRIHAASKVAVLGVIPILVASLSTGDPALILRAALIAALLVLTTPVAAHAIARAAYLEGVPVNVEPAPSSTPPEGPARRDAIARRRGALGPDGVGRRE